MKYKKNFLRFQECVRLLENIPKLFGNDRILIIQQPSLHNVIPNKYNTNIDNNNSFQYCYYNIF